MHYRFIAIITCLSSFQMNAMLKDPIMRRTVTMSPSLEIATLTSLSFLPTSEPTSEPATPKDSSFLRRVRTEHNFLNKTNQHKNCKAEKLSLPFIRAYLERLEQNRAEEKRLAEEKKFEQMLELPGTEKYNDKAFCKWLNRKSNACGYFPHSGIVGETHCSSNNLYDQGDWYP